MNSRKWGGESRLQHDGCQSGTHQGTFGVVKNSNIFAVNRINHPAKMHTKPGLTLLLTIILSFCSLNIFAQQTRRLPEPKNIIIMIGDGVGFNHVEATNYYLGIAAQVQEQFPVKLAMAHYPALAGVYDAGNSGSTHYATGYNPALAWKDTAYLKRNYTESAAAATAIATGMKTYCNSLGISVDHDTLENLVQRAKSIGKSAGVVTSVEFSHATPAGFVAHNSNRANYSQIAAEMLLNSQCDVIMGCGDPMYDNDGKPVKGKWNDAKYVMDSAFWRRFVTGSGKQVSFTVKGKMMTLMDIDGDGMPDPWTVIRDLDDFRALRKGKTPKRVMGCPKIYETLQQSRTAKNGETKNSPPYTTPFVTTVPSLPEMVSGALNVLDNNPKGFFMMIEGGAPDWAAHLNQKGRLIEEMAGFFDAVNEVVAWVEKNSSWEETLLIVTGDHETGLLWGERPFIPLADRGKGNLPVMNFNSGDHTNSLIPFYAKGVGSELYRNFAEERDSVRGPFIQNSEVAQAIHLMWWKQTSDK
ncbi:MAG: alkaline phosphatase [Bacteroidales bacterium]|nr:alkaline phosphatase [Bacteroidales bacterium]